MGKSHKPGAVKANFAIFTAMVMWAGGFPSGEVLLDSWGTVPLQSLRLFMAVSVLMIFWILTDGWSSIINAPWFRGLVVGGIGFGLGASLLLFGQKLSDPVTPAIAAAMMPIVGAVLEVLLDKRRLRFQLVVGIALAIAGGYLAAGVRLGEGTFGIGALFCLTSVVLFAWATRATTKNFESLSAIGQTTVTLAGGMVFTVIAWVALMMGGFGETQIGLVDRTHVLLLLAFALPSLAFCQLLWIWGTGGLGILLASFHMNAVPFYVMVSVVLFLGGEWNWTQAWGAALVAAGVLVAQTAERGKTKAVAG